MKSVTTIKANTQKAQDLGKAAFHNGINAPVQDKNIMAMITPNSPIGTSTHLFKAWSKGWHSENLAQIVK